MSGGAEDTVFRRSTSPRGIPERAADDALATPNARQGDAWRGGSTPPSRLSLSPKTQGRSDGKSVSVRPPRLQQQQQQRLPLSDALGDSDGCPAYDGYPSALTPAVSGAGRKQQQQRERARRRAYSGPVITEEWTRRVVRREDQHLLFAKTPSTHAPAGVNGYSEEQFRRRQAQQMAAGRYARLDSRQGSSSARAPLNSKAPSAAAVEHLSEPRARLSGGGASATHLQRRPSIGSAASAAEEGGAPSVVSSGAPSEPGTAAAAQALPEFAPATAGLSARRLRSRQIPLLFRAPVYAPPRAASAPAASSSSSSSVARRPPLFSYHQQHDWEAPQHQPQPHQRQQGVVSSRAAGPTELQKSGKDASPNKDDSGSSRAATTTPAAAVRPPPPPTVSPPTSRAASPSPSGVAAAAAPGMSPSAAESMALRALQSKSGVTYTEAYPGAASNNCNGSGSSAGNNAAVVSTPLRGRSTSPSAMPRASPMSPPTTRAELSQAAAAAARRRRPDLSATSPAPAAAAPHGGDSAGEDAAVKSASHSRRAVATALAEELSSAALEELLGEENFWRLSLRNDEYCVRRSLAGAMAAAARTRPGWAYEDYYARAMAELHPDGRTCAAEAVGNSSSGLRGDDHNATNSNVRLSGRLSGGATAPHTGAFARAPSTTTTTTAAAAAAFARGESPSVSRMSSAARWSSQPRARGIVLNTGSGRKKKKSKKDKNKLGSGVEAEEVKTAAAARAGGGRSAAASPAPPTGVTAADKRNASTTAATGMKQKTEKAVADKKVNPVNGVSSLADAEDVHGAPAAAVAANDGAGTAESANSSAAAADTEDSESGTPEGLEPYLDLVNQWASGGGAAGEAQANDAEANMMLAEYIQFFCEKKERCFTGKTAPAYGRLFSVVASDTNSGGSRGSGNNRAVPTSMPEVRARVRRQNRLDAPEGTRDGGGVRAPQGPPSLRGRWGTATADGGGAKADARKGGAGTSDSKTELHDAVNERNNNNNSGSSSSASAADEQEETQSESDPLDDGSSHEQNVRYVSDVLTAMIQNGIPRVTARNSSAGNGSVSSSPADGADKHTKKALELIFL